MNGNRAYKIEEIERNNPQFLKRLENIISDLIESGQKENKFKEYLKEGFGTYLEYLLLLCNEKHYQSSSELNTLSILNPGMKITDFTSTYNLYINSRATLEALEKSVNVNVELVEGIGISLADKYWIDDKLISLKTMMKYEWGSSDREIAEWLLGQKSHSEKSEPDSPKRQYYFDQIDLSVRLNNPNLIQNKLLEPSVPTSDQPKITLKRIGQFCFLVQDSLLISREDLTQEEFCIQVCKEFGLRYTDNVRQWFGKYDTGNNTLSKKDIIKIRKEVFPYLIESQRNTIDKYLLFKTFKQK